MPALSICLWTGTNGSVGERQFIVKTCFPSLRYLSLSNIHFCVQSHCIDIYHPTQIDVSVNAPKAGKITELLANEEDTVTVGQDLFKYEPGAAGECEKSCSAES